MRAARRALVIVDRYLVEDEVAVHNHPDADLGARIAAVARGHGPGAHAPHTGRMIPGQTTATYREDPLGCHNHWFMARGAEAGD